MKARHTNGTSAHSVEQVDALADYPDLAAIALVGAGAIRAAAARSIVWIWDQLVTDGQIVVIFGAPGAGKTSLFFLLVVARASTAPVDVLGRRVEPAPTGTYVVLIEGEHGENSAGRKLVRTTEIHGLDDATPDPLERVIVIARKELRVGSDRWDDVKALIARGLVSDLFVDSLARVAPSDANNEREQIEVFSAVSAAIEGAPGTTKPTAWIIAHARKGADAEIDGLSGHHQRAGQADTMIFCKATRDDDDQVISVKVTAPKRRDEPDEPFRAVDFSIGKDDAGRWRCKLGASARAEDTPAHERIATLLADGAKTKTQIREVLKMNGARVEKAISVLFAEKRLTKTERTVDGRKRELFSLRDAKKKGIVFGSVHRSRSTAKEEAS